MEQAGTDSDLIFDPVRIDSQVAALPRHYIQEEFFCRLPNVQSRSRFLMSIRRSIPERSIASTVVCV